MSQFGYSLYVVGIYQLHQFNQNTSVYTHVQLNDTTLNYLYIFVSQIAFMFRQLSWRPLFIFSTSSEHYIIIITYLGMEGVQYLFYRNSSFILLYICSQLCGVVHYFTILLNVFHIMYCPYINLRVSK